MRREPGRSRKHRLIFLVEDKALDTQTSIQHEKYGFTDAADVERVNGKFQVTFYTERLLKMSERRLVVKEELPDEVGLNEEVENGKEDQA